MRRRVAKVASVLLPLVLLACVLVVVLRSGTAPAGASRRRTAHAALTGHYYLGVREPGAPQAWAPVARFERASGTRVGLVLDYSGWRQPFPAAAARSARRHGAALVVQMEPWGASLSGLARGEYAGYLRTFARQVRSFGGPVVIGFGHEMNGPWYPWGSGRVPPRVFVAAWRRVVTAFRAVGADNVTWLWTVHHTADAAQLRAYWPGSSFVTWVGIDGYYEFADDTFARVFGRAAAAVRTFTGKPILASEAAVGPGAHDVPAKITNLFDGVRLDNFLGLVWFDVAQHDPPYHQDWRIVGHPADLAAFGRGAGRLRDQARVRAAAAPATPPPHGRRGLAGYGANCNLLITLSKYGSGSRLIHVATPPDRATSPSAVPVTVASNQRGKHHHADQETCRPGGRFSRSRARRGRGSAAVGHLGRGGSHARRH